VTELIWTVTLLNSAGEVGDGDNPNLGFYPNPSRGMVKTATNQNAYRSKVNV